MHLKQFVVAAFFGVGTASHVGDTYTEKHCSTKFGVQSLKTAPTVISACQKTHTVYSTKCNQKTSTHTPKPITKTITTTSYVDYHTKGSLKTDVITVVVTDSRVSTVTGPTTTVFATVTAGAKTTVFPTSTIPAPQNFRPIQDTLEGSSMEGNPNIPQKRDATFENIGSSIKERQPHSSSLFSKRQRVSDRSSLYGSFPQKVSCDVTTFVPKTIVIATTKAATTVTANAPVHKITQTITRTRTNADKMIKSTTTTNTVMKTTKIPKTTATSTITTTNTVIGPEATVYAICSSQNFADTGPDGSHFNGARVNFQRSDDTGASAESPYQCCLHCMDQQGCAGSAYSHADNRCILFSAKESLCNPGSVCTGNVNMADEPSSGGLVFMNGKAMQWTQYIHGNSGTGEK